MQGKVLGNAGRVTVPQSIVNLNVSIDQLKTVQHELLSLTTQIHPNISSTTIRGTKGQVSKCRLPLFD